MQVIQMVGADRRPTAREEPTKRKPMLVLVTEEPTARIHDLDRVGQLVAEGRSRVTAQRMVEIERGLARAGRARRHTPPQR